MAVAGLAAQDRAAAQQRPPVFRGGATFVSVDVYPRKDGRFVDGLRAENFQILEDGKPQRIETFSLIRFEPNTPDEERREPATFADAERQAADPRNRVFVVYLDLYHTTIEGSHAARQPLVNFLNRTLGATDLFGVLTPEIPVSALVFGRKTQTIEAELTGEWFWGQANRPDSLMRTPAERLLQTCGQGIGDRLVLRHREDRLMTSLEGVVRRLNALRDERMHVIFVSEGWSPRGPAPELLENLRGSAGVVGVGPGGRIAAGSPRGNACDQEIARLATTDFRERFLRLLQDAARANVSFHPVDVGGLKVGLAIADAEFSPRGNFVQAAAARDAETRASLNTLRDLAASTDGRAIVQTNDLDGGLRSIADDLVAFYLLGYYSTNPEADGRFRKIEVRIAQPGVSLTARRGYLAPDQKMVRAAELAAANAAARPVVPAPVTEALADLVRLRPEATLHAQAARSAAGLRVTLELTSRELTSGRWTKGGEVEVALVQPGREPVPVTGTLPAGARSAVVTVPIVAADAGPWRIRAAMTSGSHRLEQTLDVKSPVAGPVGDATWWRGAGAASAPFRPAAERLFRRTERLRVEWPSTAVMESRVARLLDRRGEPLGVGATVTEFERDGQRIVAADVVLAPLADGDYLLELAAGQGGATVRRLVAFRVVR